MSACTSWENGPTTPRLKCGRKMPVGNCQGPAKKNGQLRLDNSFYVYTIKICMGRPSKPDHLRRSKLFPLRLTPGDLARYEQAAHELGVSVAALFREGADLYILKRGKAGSPPKKETKQ